MTTKQQEIARELSLKAFPLPKPLAGVTTGDWSIRVREICQQAIEDALRLQQEEAWIPVGERLPDRE